MTDEPSEPPDQDRKLRAIASRISGAAAEANPGAALNEGSNEDNGIVDELNQEFALVLIGSKAVIIREQPLAAPSDRIRILTIDAFKQFMSNRSFKRQVAFWVREIQEPLVKEREINVARFWLNSPRRRSYEGIEFFPDPRLHPRSTRQQIEYLIEGTGPCPTYFNLWQGFCVTPDLQTPFETRRSRYSIFYDHLVTNICNGNEEHARWVFAWFAHIIQRPRERPGTALVLRGGEGVGKTKVGEVIGSLFASHYFLVDDPRYLTGNFNAHMATCLLLQVDEGFWAGDKAGEGRLKSLITAEVQMIEAKGVDPVRLANRVRVLFSSNEDWVVPVGMEGRRFAVFNVADHAKRNHVYFAEMEHQLDNGGREALLADLLEFDLETGPDVRIIPLTTALLEQKIRSLDPIASWWLQRLQDGAPTHRMQSWKRVVPIATLFNDYIRTSDRIGIKRKSAETEFGIRMKKLIPDLQRKRATEEIEVPGPDGRVETETRRVNCFELPRLDDCRRHLEELFSQTFEWPASDNGEEEASNADGHGDGG